MFIGMLDRSTWISTCNTGTAEPHFNVKDGMA